MKISCSKCTPEWKKLLIKKGETLKIMQQQKDAALEQLENMYSHLEKILEHMKDIYTLRFGI